MTDLSRIRRAIPKAAFRSFVGPSQQLRLPGWPCRPLLVPVERSPHTARILGSSMAVRILRGPPIATPRDARVGKSPLRTARRSCQRHGIAFAQSRPVPPPPKRASPLPAPIPQNVLRWLDTPAAGLTVLYSVYDIFGSWSADAFDGASGQQVGVRYNNDIPVQCPVSTGATVQQSTAFAFSAGQLPTAGCLPTSCEMFGDCVTVLPPPCK
jgi:hypothetical protein